MGVSELETSSVTTKLCWVSGVGGFERSGRACGGELLSLSMCIIRRCGIWKSIIPHKTHFRRFLSLKMGSGVDIRFLKDLWCGNDANIEEQVGPTCGRPWEIIFATSLRVFRLGLF